jgi:hypothetical protein
VFGFLIGYCGGVCDDLQELTTNCDVMFNCFHQIIQHFVTYNSSDTYENINNLLSSVGDTTWYKESKLMDVV